MTVQYLNHNDVLSLLPERSLDAHKGDFGKILLLCGSKGYTGAAALAAMGALRTGAGLVYLGVPECIYSIEALKLLEPIVFPLDDNGGMLSGGSLKQISHALAGKNAILMGPGLGRSEGVTAAVRFVMENFEGPVVLDADGINALVSHKYVISDRTSTTILTPHKGEFERFGIRVGNTDESRISAAEALANELNAIILLKGHRTVITDGNTTYINITGNPGMAVGGCGDVLAGMITALLGQGIKPLDAAACGAWLHGKAGDICAEEFGQYGMLPSDMLNVLPKLLK